MEHELEMRAKEDKSKFESKITFEEAVDEGIEEELEETEFEAAESSNKKEKAKINKELFSNEAILKEIEELNGYYQLAISIEKNSKGDALISALKAIFNIAKERSGLRKLLFLQDQEGLKITYPAF